MMVESKRGFVRDVEVATVPLSREIVGEPLISGLQERPSAPFQLPVKQRAILFPSSQL